MTSLKRLALVFLATTTVSILQAEIHCPGNADRLGLRTVDGYQMIVSVFVNQSGPYDFLLDTGTQYTIIDPSLAAELHISGSGSAAVAGVGSHKAASLAEVDVLKAGSHSVNQQRVVVYEFGKPASGDFRLRGILGEEFLEHFDYLIDNRHGMLCLDDTSSMRAEVKGTHIPLLEPTPTADDDPVSNQLILKARLYYGMRPVRLKLDSGTNAPFLFQPREYLAIGLYQSVSLPGMGIDGESRQFEALPPQDLKIGDVELPKVLFHSLKGERKDPTPRAFDGLLPIGLFRRILVCPSGNFVVLEPR